MAYSRGSFGFGGKLLLTILVALMAGFVWAWVERKGLKFDFGGDTSTPDKKEDVAKDPAKDPKRENGTTPKGTPDKNGGKPDKKDDTTSPGAYTDGEISSMLSGVDRHLGEARYREAWESLQQIKEIRVGTDDHRMRVRRARERVQQYLRLVAETQRGGTVLMPTMTRLDFTNGNKIVVRKLQEDRDNYHFEDIRGIRSSRPKTDFKSVKKLDQIQAFVEIWDALKQRAFTMGIDAIDEKVNGIYQYRFQDRANRKATGWQYFELADFAATNGANRLVTTLFDAALQRDPQVVSTVHETKGRIMVDVLFYFLSIDSREDAEYTLTKILTPHYSDTRAYRERLYGDAEARELISALLKHEVKIREPETKRDDDPVVVVKPPDKKDDPPSKTDPDERPNSPTSVDMPANAPAAVKKLVDDGDAAFDTGMKHLLNSDPNANPDGWTTENKKALAEFQKAASKYGEAQELYPRDQEVPRALLDRFREAQMRMSLCRKRSVSSK